MREIVCLKQSRKAKPSRPPSSQSGSRMKLNRLTNAPLSTRPPSVFNKNTLLPPIGTSAQTAACLVPSSDSSSPVAVGLSASPARTQSPHGQRSGMVPSLKRGVVSSLADGITPVDDDTLAAVTDLRCTERDQCMPSGVSASHAHSRDDTGCDDVASNDQQSTELPTVIADDFGGERSSQGSRLAADLSKRLSWSKATHGTNVAAAAACSSSSSDTVSGEIVDLPLISPSGAGLRVTDAACQCDEGISLDVKSSESGTQADGDDSRDLLAAAAAPASSSSSTAHQLSEKTKNADWLPKELISATSILGFSPSPTLRLRSGASSRTARKFHGLNAHEMQTMSNVLNTIARNQSRAAGSGAAGTPALIAGTSTGEPRVPTTERVRLTVSNAISLSLVFCLTA